MAEINLDDYIRKVKNFPEPGILFYDVTGILAAPGAFNFCIDRMVALYKDRDIQAVASIESRGFIFAAPFAARLGIPQILIRKKGKLPGKVIRKEYALEYGTAEIEIQEIDIPKGRRVLLVDDLIATGGTFRAAHDILTECGALVPEIFGVIGLPFLHYSKALPDIPVTTLINYDHE
ncbi:MAG: adenine phosphoribosyltransferase [Spirochaetaceae bacterium]|nr:adenine phosphoribosyltransferase [Spirochaetaceae bacterium]